jgi:prolyl-tRNA synthetase
MDAVGYEGLQLSCTRLLFSGFSERIFVNEKALESRSIMRLSSYFLPTLKEAPSGAQIASHRLMLRAGMVDQISSGMYAWLPLGLKTLKKISHIVREEQERAGGVEMMTPTVQPASLWKKSGRYEDYGKEMLRFQDRHEVELLYGPTGEEVFTDLFQRHIKSYKDLPQRLFQIQWKFRDEIRPRFGVMRAREFIMKDLYSFDLNKAGALASYDAMLQSYYRIFNRMNLRALAVRADTGPIGGELSHEFHILAPTGESTIYYDPALETISELCLDTLPRYHAATDDMHTAEGPLVAPENIQTSKSIEVGHVFYFGTKYSAPLGAMVTDANGALVPVEMGSYGVGLSRLVAALIEVFHDAHGIVWPESVSPFDAGLLNLKPQDPACTQLCEDLYHGLREAKVDVLYDDRLQTPGVKFADCDLIGLPYQLIMGPQGALAGTIEVKQRRSGKTQVLSKETAIDLAAAGALGTVFS